VLASAHREVRIKRIDHCAELVDPPRRRVLCRCGRIAQPDCLWCLGRSLVEPLKRVADLNRRTAASHVVLGSVRHLHQGFEQRRRASHSVDVVIGHRHRQLERRLRHAHLAPQIGNPGVRVERAEVQPWLGIKGRKVRVVDVLVLVPHLCKLRFRARPVGAPWPTKRPNAACGCVKCNQDGATREV
jgi:hypothetical protein